MNAKKTFPGDGIKLVNLCLDPLGGSSRGTDGCKIKLHDYLAPALLHLIEIAVVFYSYK